MRLPQASIRQRGSIASRFTSPLQRLETHNSSTGRLRSNSNLSDGAGEGDEKVHPVEPQPRSRTATLPPVLVGCLGISSLHRPESREIDH